MKPTWKDLLPKKIIYTYGGKEVTLTGRKGKCVTNGRQFEDTFVEIKRTNPSSDETTFLWISQYDLLKIEEAVDPNTITSVI